MTVKMSESSNDIVWLARVGINRVAVLLSNSNGFLMPLAAQVG